MLEDKSDHSVSKKLKCNINRRLLPMKGHYFLFNAGIAPVVGFMSIYAKQLGFSSVVVGIIYTILPFSGMLAKPLMGAIADRYKCQKIIFLVAQLVAASTFLGMVFLPAVPTRSKMHFGCNDLTSTLDTCLDEIDTCTTSRLKDDSADVTMMCGLNCPLKPDDWDVVCKYWNASQYCTAQRNNNFEFTAYVPMKSIDQVGNCIYFSVGNVTLQDGSVRHPYCPHQRLSLVCDLKCDSYILNEVINKSAVEDGDVYKLSAFWLLLCVYLISWLGQAVTVSVGDTICFQLLEDKPIRYGYQRMFGALGWGTFSIISGLLLDAFSKGRVTKNYGPVFCIGVVMILLCVIVSSQIQYTQRQLSPSIIKDIGRLLCNLQIFIFILWCICVGMCTSLMWNFLFWLLEELASHHGCEMQSWIKTIEGLAFGIQSLAGELPFFFLSNWILKRIGHIHAMTLVLLVLGGRFILYSLITNPWHTLPIEFLNGITFGLLYATMASYASIVAPPGVETTTQGLVGAVFEGIGVSSGSFMAGILFKAYGGSMTFRIYGVSAVVVAMVHGLVRYLMEKPNVKDSVVMYSAPNDAIQIVNINKTLELSGT